jgi:hypothetical protein
MERLSWYFWSPRQQRGNIPNLVCVCVEKGVGMENM